LVAFALPAQAGASVPTVGTLFWPFDAARSASFDSHKPMCVGVEVSPVWGDRGEYTGACRYGAPLGPMAAAIKAMDQRAAVGTAREHGLPAAFGVKLRTELANIYELPMPRARARLKRDAESGRKPWVARAAVNCAVFGAAAAGLTALYDLAVKHELEPDGLSHAAALGCAGAVVTPSLNKWVKAKGFRLED
jgi:hypothetical protein